MGNRVSFPDRPIPLHDLLTAAVPTTVATTPAKHASMIAAWRFPDAVPIAASQQLAEFTPADAFVVVRVYDPARLRAEPCPAAALNRAALDLCLSGAEHLHVRNVQIPLNVLRQSVTLPGGVRLRYQIYAWTGNAVADADRCAAETKAFELVVAAAHCPAVVLGRIWTASSHLPFPLGSVVAADIIHNPIFVSACCCHDDDDDDGACRKENLQLDLAGIAPMAHDGPMTAASKALPHLIGAGLSEEQQKLALLEHYAPQSSLIEPNLFVVNAALDACRNSFPDRLTYLGLRLSDSKHEDIICRVYDVIDFIETALMVKRSLSFHDAFELVKARRDIVSPNIGFSVALIQWHRRLQVGAADAPIFYRITSFSPDREPLCIVAKITDLAAARIDSRAVYVLQTDDAIHVWIGTRAQRLLYAYARQTLIPRLQRFEHGPGRVVDERDGAESDEFRARVGRRHGPVSDGCLGEYDAEYRALILPLPDRADPVAHHRTGSMSHRPSSSTLPVVLAVASHTERNHAGPVVVLRAAADLGGEEAGDVAVFYSWPCLEEIEVFGPEDLHDACVFVFVKRRSRARCAKLYIWAGAEVDLGPDANEFVATIAKDCIARLGLQSLETTILYEEAGDESDEFWDLF